MTNDGGPAVDTGREAVERLARRLSSIPLDMTVNEFDAAGATLRALLAERDTLAAANATLAEEIEEITAIADRGVVLHGEAAEIMSSLEAQRDAALAERDRMRAALETIIAQDWWDAAERHGDETYAVDGHCAEIARAALAPKPLS